jgi:hypothetical protein
MLDYQRLYITEIFIVWNLSSIWHANRYRNDNMHDIIYCCPYINDGVGGSISKIVKHRWFIFCLLALLFNQIILLTQAVIDGMRLVRVIIM